MTHKFKTAYDPHTRKPTELDPKSLTHQSMSPECDINSIMKKYERTGVLEHRNRFEGSYGDFTASPADYQESMNAVLAAEDMFSSLPSKIRRRFHNDPGAFIEYVGNPDNQEEMISLGLATRTSDDLLENSGTPTPKSSKKAPEPSKSEPTGSEKSSAE
jgi:phage internal scaffolding protein